MLPEKRIGIESVKGDSIRSGMNTTKSAVVTYKSVLPYELGQHTASIGPVETSWVLPHQYEERGEGMFRRLWF